ncbi:MAG: hypothetical protein HRU09_11115 [Oligoflexales bacterium]|nr:hypothetical protein [Oligoflexales bacterium]
MSCHHENETDYFIDSERELIINLAEPSFNLSNLPTLSFFQIDSNGMPVAVSGEYVDSAKQLRLELDLELALGTDLSKADQIVGITPETNTSLLQESSWHGETLRSLRFELRPELDNLASQTVWHGQDTVPISHLEFASNSSEINAELNIQLIEVGYAKVFAFDSLGQAIKGAILTPILESNTDLGFGPVSLSLHDPYRPVRSITNEEGYSQVGPLYIGDENAQFRVHAWAPGFCSYVSEPILFSEISEENSPKIVLNKCTNELEGPFKIAFAEEESTFKEFYDLIEYDVAYTNQDQIKIRLDHLDELPRSGFSIKVYESFAYPFQSAPIFEHSYEKFESKISIPTPIAFTTGSALSGSFTVEVIPKEPNQPEQSMRLLAKKSISRPGLDYLNSLVISSRNGNENIISGSEAGEFVINSEGCNDGDSLGFINTLQDAFFSLCKDGKAVFKSVDVRFLRDEDKQGSYERVKIYLKDRYNNISEDDPDNRNEIQIFVDYGAPEIDEVNLKMGIQLGFYQRDLIAGSGSNLDPYLFSTDRTLELQASNLQDYSFGFTRPSNCRLTNGSSQDGQEFSNLGLQISEFAIGPATSSSDQVNPCHNTENTNLISLNSDMFVFPAEPGQDAFFEFRVIDLAGNISNSYSAKIPACSDSLPIQTHACWKP